MLYHNESQDIFVILYFTISETMGMVINHVLPPKTTFKFGGRKSLSNTRLTYAPACYLVVFL